MSDQRFSLNTSPRSARPRSISSLGLVTPLGVALFILVAGHRAHSFGPLMNLPLLWVVLLYLSGWHAERSGGDALSGSTQGRPQ